MAKVSLAKEIKIAVRLNLQQRCVQQVKQRVNGTRLQSTYILFVKNKMNGQCRAETRSNVLCKLVTDTQYKTQSSEQLCARLEKSGFSPEATRIFKCDGIKERSICRGGSILRGATRAATVTASQNV